MPLSMAGLALVLVGHDDFGLAVSMLTGKGEGVAPIGVKPVVAVEPVVPFVGVLPACGPGATAVIVPAVGVVVGFVFHVDDAV